MQSSLDQPAKLPSRAISGVVVAGLICWVGFRVATPGHGADDRDRRQRGRGRAAPSPGSRNDCRQLDAAPMATMTRGGEGGASPRDGDILERMQDVTGPEDDFATRLAIVRDAGDRVPGSRPAPRSPKHRTRVPQGERADPAPATPVVVHPEPLRLRQAFVEQVRRAIHEDR